MEGATASAPTSAPSSAPIGDASAVSAPTGVETLAPAPSLDTTSQQISSPSSGENILSSAPVADDSSIPLPSTDASIPASGLTPEVSDQNINWMDKIELSQELRDNPNISKYKTLDDALSSIPNLAKKLGEKGIMKPEEGSDQEAWDAWYSHLGRPVNPDGYSEYKPPTEIDAEGKEHSLYDIDPDLYKGAKETFHEIGLDDAQHQKMMDFFVKYEVGQANNSAEYNAQQAQRTMAELQTEFGAEYKARIQSAVNIAKTLGMHEMLIEKGLGNDKSMIMALDMLNSRIGEANITGDTSPTGGGFESAIENLKNDPAYNDKSHPDYDAIQKRKIDLYARKYSQ